MPNWIDSTLKLIVFSTLLLNSNINAEEKYTYGIGLGSLYNGLGGSLSLKGSNSISYLAIGCPAIGYGSGNGFISTCGLGAGYIKSNIFSKSNKHGIGMHIGYSYIDNAEVSEFGPQFGLSYVYFVEGIHSKGWNYGLTPTVSRYSNRNNLTGIFQIGYQY